LILSPKDNQYPRESSLLDRRISFISHLLSNKAGKNKVKKIKTDMISTR
jgi:hypothetical protein